MGHDKLRKFAENQTFSCLLQPDSRELLKNGYFNLCDHPIKGNWSATMFSGNKKSIVLELGCGKGEYTVDLARRKPSANYIGVDIKGARLWKGAKEVTENAIDNVAFLRTRVEFINAFFGEDEVDEIWLTFSDPQYRSENSRLCSPLFLERYRKFLKPGGIIHLKTDSMFLHQYCKAVVEANGLKILACTEDLYGSDLELADEVRGVQTFYERLFLDQGYKITYISFTLDSASKQFVAPENFDSDYWRSVEGPRILFGHDSAETKRQKSQLSR